MIKTFSLLGSLKHMIISESWNKTESIGLLKPNEKPSANDPDKGIYRSMIERVLLNNLNLLQQNGISNVGGHYFYSGTQDGHPLSYLNTHFGVAHYFMNYFKVPEGSGTTKEQAVDIIEKGLQKDFQKLLLDPTTRENKKIMSMLSESKDKGELNEKLAIEYLQNRYPNNTITNTSETGGALDKAGVDIVMTEPNGSTINYQVKPFGFYYISDDGNAVIFKVSGAKTVNKKQNRFIFVDSSSATNPKFLEVDAKNLRVGERQRNVMFLPLVDIISKSSNLKAWIPKDKPIVPPEPTPEPTL